ncbi:histidine phosphatase family protein [Roseococcus sp. SDR]|uniref:histidine phosphatase family protein n=1 Tax=Roseococcus sp. SDR TaxID=2835532 RepID=UPI001BD16ADC|nr:histidine phosphatase family protein [Roseococcus sp. SDR]MBS7792235.1 histidine phosphatase family protein [Roseococcus sp. SDR]MBV1847549.1 histidine phosphatase family protein [Roseococcus sp. SDR]
MTPRLILLALLLLGLGAPAVRAEPGLLAALREGGLVIFLRHAETGSSAPDQMNAVLGDCATQRNLDATGRAQAVAIGAAFRELGIPVSRVLASPYCRTLETAALAFGRAEPEMGLSLPRHVDAAAHRAMGAALRQLLPEPGFAGNWVLIGHSYHMMGAGGPAPQPQGAAVVLRPEGEGRFAVLAMLPPEGWAWLGRQRVAAAAAPPTTAEVR